MEGADQVLAVAGVDASLAADGAIDLGEQGGRYLHVVEPAQGDGGGEPGEVADDAASQRHQCRVAPHLPAEQIFGEPFQVGEILGLFAGRQGNDLMFDAGLAERRLHGREIKRRDVRIGDHDNPGLDQQGPYVTSRRRQQSFADQYVITTRTEVDAHPFDAGGGFSLGRRHGPEPRSGSRAPMILSTVTLGGSSLVSTTMLASAYTG